MDLFRSIYVFGASGMRSGVLALPANNGSPLVAWKKDDQLGWQLYDERGQPSGLPGNAASPGKGVAAVVVKNGDVVLFRSHLVRAAIETRALPNH